MITNVDYFARRDLDQMDPVFSLRVPAEVEPSVTVVYDVNAQTDTPITLHCSACSTDQQEEPYYDFFVTWEEGYRAAANHLASDHRR